MRSFGIRAAVTAELAVAEVVGKNEHDVWAIGADEPAPPGYIAERATFMRGWLTERYGLYAVDPIPIIYGGAVFPENAEWLLTTPDIDGLGPGRKSRDAGEFASIAKLVGKAFNLI